MKEECKSISGRLGAYSDKELPEEKHRKVERHLEACRKCTVKLVELEAAGAAIKTALSCNESDMDFSGIWKKIESNTDLGPSLWQRITRVAARPIVWMPAAFAGAAACLLICFVLVPDRQTPMQASRVESVYSSTGQVMVMQTAKSGSPLIWILPETDKEAG